MTENKKIFTVIIDSYDKLEKLLIKFENVANAKYETKVIKNTKTGVSYVENWREAKSILEKIIKNLSDEREKLIWDGLQLKKSDDHKADIVNSLMGAWDKVASKIMKHAKSEDITKEKEKLYHRLSEFNDTIFTNGRLKITKDQ
jgi:hypothetical protein